MSWRDGDTILVKGLPILQEHFPEQTECAIYLSGFIATLCESDFDYIQFRESPSPYSEIFEYVDQRDKIYQNAYRKIDSDLKKISHYRVLGHYMAVTGRNIKQAELKKYKTSAATIEKAFHALWDLSSKYIEDEEHLHYYTQYLMDVFMFTPDDRDALAKSNEALEPILELIRKDEEAANESLQRHLKKAKNLPELDQLFKKVEGPAKRSLTALVKRSKAKLSKTPNAKVSLAAEPKQEAAPPSNKQLLDDDSTAPSSDLGFAASLDSTIKQHIKIIAKKTGQAESVVQSTLEAYEECILDDLENKNRTRLLTLMILKASVKEAKPERVVVNPFTGEEVLFTATPGRLRVKAIETIRLKDLLAISIGESSKQSDTKIKKKPIAKKKAKKG